MGGFNIDINSLRGKIKAIAQKVDKQNDSDNKISGYEISIFLHDCKAQNIDVKKEPWYKGIKDFLSKPKLTPIVAENDNTRYESPVVPDQKIKKSETTKLNANANSSLQNNSELSKPTTFSSNSDVRTNYDWSVEEFEKVLENMLLNPKYRGKFKKSVLLGKAEAFIKSAKDYNIDPRMLVAISMCESERGISKKALTLNNVGGLKINGKYHHFKSVEASIDSIAKTIDTRYKEGYTTPSKVAYSGEYCAKSASSNWLKNVKFYLNQFNNHYDN